MPTPTKYTYSISGSFPNHVVATDRLTLEIGQSSIVTALSFIATSGDNCDIWFKDVLSGGDQTTLNAVVAAHSGQPLSGSATTGSISALNGTFSFTPTGSGNVGVQISGTWVATLSFEGTVDGQNWFSIDAVAVTSSTPVTYVTANGQWRVNTSGMSQVRVKATAYTSGSASVTILSNSSTAVVRAVNNLFDFDPRLIHRFGNLTSAATAEVLMCSRGYAEPASQAQRSVVSTSVQDAPAGSGAVAVRITYLDSNYNLATEDITLNGTTPVNTVGTTIRFIEKFQVIQGAAAAGAIKIMSATAGGGTEVAGIASGTEDAFLCHHYVPAGKKAFILGWGAVTDGNANFKLKGQQRFGANLVDQNLDLENLTGIATQPGRLDFYKKLPVPLPIGEKCYIRITVVPGQVGSTVERVVLDIWEDQS